MDPLSESEMTEIVSLQRVAGVQRLSRHFSWPEFSDERRSLHQELVYDVAVFAAERGFSWANVVRAAGTVKSIFPQLDDVDTLKLASLLKDVLCEQLPDLTPVQRCEFARYLTDTLVARRRLFQAVVRGAANMSIVQMDLEVQLPPTPCPLSEGMDLHEWEAQQLNSTLQQKQEELTSLRDGPRVLLENVSVPKDQSIEESVRAAVRSTEGQILDNLNQEVNLLGDIMQLKLQQTAMATRGRQSPSTHRTTPVKGNKQQRIKKQ